MSHFRLCVNVPLETPPISTFGYSPLQIELILLNTYSVERFDLFTKDFSMETEER